MATPVFRSRIGASKTDVILCRDARRKRLKRLNEVGTAYLDLLGSNTIKGTFVVYALDRERGAKCIRGNL